MQLALATAQKQTTMVIVGTESVAVYLRHLLESVQDHSCMTFGGIAVVTSEMSLHEVCFYFETAPC